MYVIVYKSYILCLLQYILIIVPSTHSFCICLQMTQKARMRISLLPLTIRDNVVTENRGKYPPPAHHRQGVHHGQSTHPKQEVHGNLEHGISNVSNLY